MTPGQERVGSHQHPGQQCRHPARQELRKNGADGFRTVMDVHLMGSVHCTKAVWDIMREQNYGRIVMTTSSSGLYGNFGQSNYGSASGRSRANERPRSGGAQERHPVNTLSPTAATRMTEDLIPSEMLALITPESITPGLLYLVSEDAPTRTILCAGAGAFAVARIVETKGAYSPKPSAHPKPLPLALLRLSTRPGHRLLRARSSRPTSSSIWRPKPKALGSERGSMIPAERVARAVRCAGRAARSRNARGPVLARPRRVRARVRCDPLDAAETLSCPPASSPNGRTTWP